MNQTVRGGWFYGADGCWSARRGGYYDSPDRGNFLSFRLTKREHRSHVARGGSWAGITCHFSAENESHRCPESSQVKDPYSGFRIARRKRWLR